MKLDNLFFPTAAFTYYTSSSGEYESFGRCHKSFLLGFSFEMYFKKDFTGQNGFPEK